MPISKARIRHSAQDAILAAISAVQVKAREEGDAALAEEIADQAQKLADRWGARVNFKAPQS